MSPQDAEIRVRLTPRARRDGVVGWEAGRLRARVAAAPLDGKANAALIRLVAAALGVPRRRVALVRGEHARAKTLRVEGLSETEVWARLTAAMAETERA